MIGLMIGWSWRPRWTGIVFLGLRSKLRFAWTLPPGIRARWMWLAFIAFSEFSVRHRFLFSSRGLYRFKRFARGAASPEIDVAEEDGRDATKSGSRMSREQYGALRRKIGGTYKDFFKSYVEVDGEYVEEGWVDKMCKICKKDTRGAARQVDKLGRYVHVECMENKKSGNFFTKLFSF